MKIFKGFLFALAVISLSGCVSTSDIMIEKSTSDKVNFSGYKTYQIIEGSGLTDETKVKNVKAVDAEIQKIIVTELAKHGKALTTEDPDFFVAYLAGNDPKAVEIKVDKAGHEEIKKAPASGIVLMFVDADSGSIIWIATAEGDMKNISMSERKERLQYAVKKMLSGL